MPLLCSSAAWATYLADLEWSVRLRRWGSGPSRGSEGDSEGDSVAIIFAVIIGVASALIAAIIWALFGRSVTYWQRRHGFLTGWWWQITYPPLRDTVLDEAQITEVSQEGADLAFSELINSEPPETDDVEVSVWTLPDTKTLPWSIELTHVRHQGNEILADCWRVFNSTDKDPHYDRKWSCKGRCADDAVIDAYYWSRHGEGGHGTFQLWMITRGRFYGQFQESKTKVRNKESSNEFISSYLAWIRLGSDKERERVLPWFEPPTYKLNDKARSWPRKVRRRMSCVFAKSQPVGWLARFAYACALYDLLPPLTIERLRRELAHGQERSREHEPRQDSLDDG